jgi:acetyl esterase/lipase
MTAPLLMNPGGLSPEAEARLRRRVAGDSNDLGVPDLRDIAAVRSWRVAQHRAWGEEKEEGEADHMPISVAGIRCLRAGNPTSARRGTLVYLHGGGFSLGSPGTALAITARLAMKSPVVSVDYRLAPKYPFPAALDDAERVVTALAAEGPVIVSGDSAGGCLAAGLAVRGLCFEALVLLCPLLDLTGERDELTSAYLADADADNAMVSPLSATDDELGRFPPTLLQSTTGDKLHRQAVSFGERLRSVEVPVTHQVWGGLWHAWHYHRELPEAWMAVDQASHFASGHL